MVRYQSRRPLASISGVSRTSEGPYRTADDADDQRLPGAFDSLFVAVFTATNVPSDGDLKEAHSNVNKKLSGVFGVVLMRM